MVWPMASLRSKLQVEKPYIIGGQDATRGEFKHQVSMQVSVAFFYEQHICGATLIAPDWVLTAAHCVKGVPWYASAFILAGKNNLAEQEDGQQRSAVKKMIAHEKYNTQQNSGVGPYDIGLLQLKTPVTYNQWIQPAQLPVQDVVPSGMATLSGWGSVSTTQDVVIPDVLQKLDLPIIPFAECYAFIDELVKKDDPPSANPLADTNICVGYLDKNGTGSCSGDSGGPLTQKDGDKAIVLGATSWGYFPCGDEPAPSVYTRVSAYIPWIQDKMSSN